MRRQQVLNVFFFKYTAHSSSEEKIQRQVTTKCLVDTVAQSIPLPPPMGDATAFVQMAFFI